MWLLMVLQCIYIYMYTYTYCICVIIMSYYCSRFIIYTWFSRGTSVWKPGIRLPTLSLAGCVDLEGLVTYKADLSWRLFWCTGCMLDMYIIIYMYCWILFDHYLNTNYKRISWQFNVRGMLYCHPAHAITLWNWGVLSRVFCESCLYTFKVMSNFHSDSNCIKLLLLLIHIILFLSFLEISTAFQHSGLFLFEVGFGFARVLYWAILSWALCG